MDQVRTDRSYNMVPHSSRRSDPHRTLDPNSSCLTHRCSNSLQDSLAQSRRNQARNTQLLSCFHRGV